MKLGEIGEGLASKFLKEHGYKIIKRNYKTAIGEIDIIAEDSGTLVFVEVKTRENTAYGQPFEAVNRHKQRKIANVALLYLKGLKELPPCRFDVVSVCVTSEKQELKLIKDAFEV